VSRAGVAHGILFHVHEYVDRGHKMMLELSAQRVIQSSQDPRGITGVRGLSG